MKRRPLRVLSVDNTFTFGGAINALSYLLSALDRERYEPLVVSAQPQRVLDRLFPDIAARHWPMRLSWVHGPIHRRVLGTRFMKRRGLRWIWGKARAAAWIPFVDLPAAARIVRFARRHGIDLVHLNNGVEGMLPALMAAKWLRIPVVAHARSPQATTGIVRRYARLPDRWIAVSETMTANLIAMGVDRCRIDTVHDAIDITAFHGGTAPPGLRPELGLPEGAPVFGVFGRIIPWKGIREFVEAATLAIRDVPEAHALVVGDPSDGAANYYHAVREYVRDQGMDDRIHFTGYRQDVADVMRLCDVVVHSSIVPEPFGMTVIEAMATGTPVVAADSGGPTEIIADGRTGLLVDPTDPAALASTIAALISDRQLATRIGRGGAERARSHYTARRYAREVEAVFDRVIGKS